MHIERVSNVFTDSLERLCWDLYRLFASTGCTSRLTHSTYIPTQSGDMLLQRWSGWLHICRSSWVLHCLALLCPRLCSLTIRRMLIPMTYGKFMKVDPRSTFLMDCAGSTVVDLPLRSLAWVSFLVSLLQERTLTRNCRHYLSYPCLQDSQERASYEAIPYRRALCRCPHYPPFASCTPPYIAASNLHHNKLGGPCSHSRAVRSFVHERGVLARWGAPSLCLLR